MDQDHSDCLATHVDRAMAFCRRPVLLLVDIRIVAAVDIDPTIHPSGGVLVTIEASLRPDGRRHRGRFIKPGSAEEFIRDAALGLTLVFAVTGVIESCRFGPLLDGDGCWADMASERDSAAAAAIAEIAQAPGGSALYAELMGVEHSAEASHGSR